MLTFALQPLAACFGTIAFCIFFRVPAKYFPTCGLVGAISWIIYLAANTRSAITGGAVFCAALTVVLLSRFFSVRRRCPVTIFLIAGIFPLVPGAGIYNTGYAAMTGDTSLAVTNFLAAFKAAFAIAITVSIGVMIPTRYFAMIERRVPHISRRKQANQKK